MDEWREGGMFVGGALDDMAGLYVAKMVCDTLWMVALGLAIRIMVMDLCCRRLACGCHE